jgi:hypothetical protein
MGGVEVIAFHEDLPPVILALAPDGNNAALDERWRT